MQAENNTKDYGEVISFLHKYINHNLRLVYESNDINKTRELCGIIAGANFMLGYLNKSYSMTDPIFNYKDDCEINFIAIYDVLRENIDHLMIKADPNYENDKTVIDKSRKAIEQFESSLAVLSEFIDFDEDNKKEDYTQVIWLFRTVISYCFHSFVKFESFERDQLEKMHNMMRSYEEALSLISDYNNSDWSHYGLACTTPNFDDFYETIQLFIDNEKYNYTEESEKFAKELENIKYKVYNKFGGNPDRQERSNIYFVNSLPHLIESFIRKMNKNDRKEQREKEQKLDNYNEVIGFMKTVINDDFKYFDEESRQYQDDPNYFTNLYYKIRAFEEALYLFDENYVPVNFEDFYPSNYDFNFSYLIKPFNKKVDDLSDLIDDLELKLKKSDTFTKYLDTNEMIDFLKEIYKSFRKAMSLLSNTFNIDFDSCRNITAESIIRTRIGWYTNIIESKEVNENFKNSLRDFENALICFDNTYSYYEPDFEQTRETSFANIIKFIKYELDRTVTRIKNYDDKKVINMRKKKGTYYEDHHISLLLPSWKDLKRGIQILN